MSDLRRRQLNRRPDRQAAALAEDRRHGVTTYPIVRRCWCLEMRRAWHRFGQEVGLFGFKIYCGTCSPSIPDPEPRLRLVRLATEGGRTYGKAARHPAPWYLTWPAIDPIPQGSPVYVNDANQVTLEPGAAHFIGYAVSRSDSDGTVTVTIGGV